MERFIHWFWQYGVNYGLYILLILVTLWTSKVIMFDSLKHKYSEWNYKYRLRRIQNKRNFSRKTQYRNPLSKHLHLLLRTTREEQNDYDVPVFILFSGTLGVVFSVFILIVFGDIFVGVIFGLLVTLIPYLFIRLRLNKIRSFMSEDFLFIVQKLTQNYNASHYDMYYALTETQKEIRNPILRKVIVKLVSDLQVSRNEQELQESIQVFTYTAGTNWSKRLGSIVLKAYLHNENVLNALMVLTKQMEDTEEMIEEEKSTTMDSVYNGYLTLPIFIGSLFLGYVSSGAQDWFKLQFGNQWTLLLFSICVLGVIFSLIISLFLKRPSNDI